RAGGQREVGLVGGGDRREGPGDAGDGGAGDGGAGAGAAGDGDGPAVSTGGAAGLGEDPPPDFGGAALGGATAGKPCPELLDPDFWVIEGDVIVDAQAELEALTGVGEITGDLNIGKTWDQRSSTVTSLERLSCLRVVHGNLVVGHNDELSTLRGFDSLTRVD